MILQRLSDNAWVSGEELAAELGVSRVAVAKHIDKLRRAGHVIRSRTHKGYMLEIPAEAVERDRVAPFLRTGLLGRTEWRELPTTTSTNSEAVAWALDGAPAGGVVTACEQTRGKGRRGHSWFSSPRGLHLSIILPPSRRGADEAKINLAVLQAARLAIARVAGLEATIKKPNDLLLHNRKVAGVLVESGRRGGEADWLVAGMGCNVNVLPEEFPEEIRGRVTSLYAEGGRAVSKNRLCAEILNNLEDLLGPDIMACV